jgi:hypothetical protein
MRISSVSGFSNFSEATPLPPQYLGRYKALTINVLESRRRQGKNMVLGFDGFSG